MEKDKSFKLVSVPKNKGLELKLRKIENIKGKLLNYKENGFNKF